MDERMIKQCSKCRVDKTIDEFYRNKSNASGRDHYCRACRKEHHNEWYVSARGREWKKEFQKTPAYLEYMKGYQKTDKRSAYMKAFRQTEAAKFADLNAQALKKVIVKVPEDIVTLDQWKVILERYNYACAYCGKKKKLELDHYIPLSNGGRHAYDNIVPACKSCNARKGNRAPLPFFQSA